MRRDDLTGKMFGRLTAVEPSHSNQQGWHWRCRCACGAETVVNAYRLKSGHTQSCGCLHKDGLIERNRAMEHKHKLPDGTASMRALIRDYRRSAGKKRLVWALTEQECEALFKATCHYCGAAPGQVIRHARSTPFTYNGLDRKDNRRGYIADNVVPCCGACNVAKNDRSEAEFLAWVQRVHAHRKNESFR